MHQFRQALLEVPLAHQFRLALLEVPLVHPFRQALLEVHTFALSTCISFQITQIICYEPYASAVKLPNFQGT